VIYLLQWTDTAVGPYSPRIPLWLRFSRGGGMPHTTYTLESVRRSNLGAVLRSLHVLGPQSRSELGARLALARSTTGQLVADLASRGLVYEDASAPSGAPGRPSPVVQPASKRIAALAIEVAVDSLAVALVGLGGQIHSLTRIDHDPSRLGPGETVEDLVPLVQAQLAGAPGGCRVLGVGVAFHGVVRRHDGFVHLSPNLGWRDVPLGAMLSSRLPIQAPIIVANNADMGALAEQARGAARGMDDIVYLHGEVGIAGGIIAGGNPLEGTAGCAGEVGHMLVNPVGLPCPCGASGCWETEAGELALLRHAGRAGDGLRPAAVAAILCEAQQEVPAARAAVQAVGQWLGVGIATLVNIFNPELVVLGGFFGQLYPQVETVLREQVRTRALSPARNFVNIVPATLGADAAVLGAAELIFAPVVADPTLVPVQSDSSE